MICLRQQRQWQRGLLFAFGLLISSFLSVQAQSEPINRVSFDDLIKNPEKFDGQTIRTKAIYVVGFEDAWLEPYPKRRDQNQRIPIDFDPSWQLNSRRKALAKLNKDTKIDPQRMRLRYSVVLLVVRVQYQVSPDGKYASPVLTILYLE